MQCFDEDYVVKRIQAVILPLQEEIRKNPNWSDNKKAAKLLELNQTFDIAKCGCFRDKKGVRKTEEHFIYSNCVCPENNKILNFPTYHAQIFDKHSVMFVSEEEKEQFEAIFSRRTGNFK